MIVIIKSAPDTIEASRGIKLARDMAAGILLVGDAVCLAQRDRLEGYCGTVYAIEEEIKLRGVDHIEHTIKLLDYDVAIDLMAEDGKVIGMF